MSFKNHESTGFKADAQTSPSPPKSGHPLDAGDLDFSPQEQKDIIRRVDRRLVLMVGALYCISLMDRTNLGVANIGGMAKELKLVGNQYSVMTLVFFVTYTVFQPPSTVTVRKLGPRLHLATITMLWGACMIGMGFVNSWNQMAALRAVLGVLEAGFFPSSVYLLSTWYTRYEVGKRYAVFYIVGCVSTAFSGILAYGIVHMDGLANLSGWRWIFIMMGLITCVLASIGALLLVDFPDANRPTWSFLDTRQRAWVCARVNADRGDATPEAFSLAKFLSAARDPKIWVCALMFFDTTTISYALAYFLPIILNKSMGFSIGASQCLIAPPYVFAGVIIYATGYLGDRYKIRGPIIVFNSLLCIIGLPIMGFARRASVRYFGVFLTAAGANSNVPAVMTYQANNVRGQWKRALCSATMIGAGGIGGIAGSLVFRSQDAPDYRPGLYACMACSSLSIILVGVQSAIFCWLTKQADRDGKELESTDENMQTGFRYTY